MHQRARNRSAIRLEAVLTIHRQYAIRNAALTHRRLALREHDELAYLSHGEIRVFAAKTFASSLSFPSKFQRGGRNASSDEGAVGRNRGDKSGRT